MKHSFVKRGADPLHVRFRAQPLLLRDPRPGRARGSGAARPAAAGPSARRMLAWAGESRYYTEPKRLAKLGYLAARKEPGKTRERTVYTLTDKGLEALREYAEPRYASRRSRATRSCGCSSATSSARPSRVTHRDATRRHRRHRGATQALRGAAARSTPSREVPAHASTSCAASSNWHVELVDRVERELGGAANQSSPPIPTRTSAPRRCARRPVPGRGSPSPTRRRSAGRRRPAAPPGSLPRR